MPLEAAMPILHGSIGKPNKGIIRSFLEWLGFVSPREEAAQQKHAAWQRHQELESGGAYRLHNPKEHTAGNPAAAMARRLHEMQRRRMH